MKKDQIKKQIKGIFGFTLLMFLLNSTVLLATNGITDNEITNAVERQLVINANTPSQLIDVETLNGIVTLSGQVNNMLEKDQVVKVAQMVKGVRAVVDKMEVNTPVRNDYSIEREIRNDLLNDPATESWEVIADVSDGIVTLSGTVDSWQERKLSEFIAKNVRGVKDIKNNIDIDYKTDRPDFRIEEEIKRTMEYDVRVDHILVDVEVNQGDVTLAGTVGSLVEKHMAIADAWVAGVKSVNSDNLEVKRWARDDDLRKNKYIEKTDEEVKKAVKDAFIHDPRVYSFNPEVSVDMGYVTLKGTVNNLQAKRAAENTARNVVGVFGVNNNLKVRPVIIPENSELEANIAASLRKNPLVERYDINVNAINGIVYLNGEVDTYFEKSQAENIASRTKGVVDVRNNLKVQGSDDYDYFDYYGWNTYYPPLHDMDIDIRKSDTEIKNSIESQLWWSPYVNQDDVEVSVSGGTAVLTGTVETEREKRYAEINALEGGAKEVDNHIIVLYPPSD
jgi:osmotically-inducible protein OsmY